MEKWIIFDEVIEYFTIKKHINLNMTILHEIVSAVTAWDDANYIIVHLEKTWGMRD